MTPKPDPQMFAKHVLWNLCGVQARLQQMEALLAKLAEHQLGTAAEKILDHSSAEALRVQTQMFVVAMADAGLGVSGHGGKPPPETPESRG